MLTKKRYLLAAAPLIWMFDIELSQLLDWLPRATYDINFTTLLYTYDKNGEVFSNVYAAARYLARHFFTFTFVQVDLDCKIKI